MIDEFTEEKLAICEKQWQAAEETIKQLREACKHYHESLVMLKRSVDHSDSKHWELSLDDHYAVMERGAMAHALT